MATRTGRKAGSRRAPGRKRPLTSTLAFRLRDRRLAWAAVGLAVALASAVAWYVWPYWRLSGDFRSLPAGEPSRLYARPLYLEIGGKLSQEALASNLAARGYSPAPGTELGSGTFRTSGDEVAIARRRFPSALADHGGNVLLVRLRGGKIAGLEVAGKRVEEALLDPLVIASFYGHDLREVRPRPLSEVSPQIVRAVLAAEDAGFFEHPGLSLSGIVRALWTNLRGGEVLQGGSTVTQQLVKNLYVGSERKFSRKIREAILSLMLEWRYTKQQILEGYLNQIYWGKAGSANLIGVGAAAAAYCGKEPAELSLAEAALIAGMIRSPGEYAPAKHPEAAKARRDQVLDRLAELKWIARDEIEAAKRQPLPEGSNSIGRSRAPYFVAAAEREAAARFELQDLADRGLALLSTLDLGDQEVAESSVANGLEALANEFKGARRTALEKLEAALVSVEPATGAVRAWVGGRDFRASQFDRANQARRQAGSAFKPIVYAAAFENGVATPGTLLEDDPLTLTIGGNDWTPMDDDGEFRGWVTARTALEQSLNVPTVRLALQTGLPKIVETARRMGIATPLSPVPAVALGAFAISPVELLTVYATLANGGVRPAFHALEAVVDADGSLLAGEALPAPEQVLSPESAYLVTSILEGVVAEGTAARARQWGLADAVAGKTGTTNERRDCWFSGYTPDRATVVWVGFDDNSPTPFHGAKAALPIWTTFTVAVRPAAGYATFRQPEGIRVLLVDPATGELATDRCPSVLSEAFPADRVPTALCHLHAGFFSKALDPGARVAPPPPVPEERGFRAWLRRIFHRSPKRAPQPPP